MSSSFSGGSHFKKYSKMQLRETPDLTLTFELHTHAYIYTYVHIYIHVNTHRYMHVHVYTHMKTNNVKMVKLN